MQMNLEHFDLDIGSEPVEVIPGRRTCHQKIVKLRRVVRGIDWDKSTAEVREIPLATARPFIEQYEYLGNLGAADRAVALILNGITVCVECYQFAKPGGKITLFGERAITLCRGASLGGAPPWVGSYLIPRATRYICKQYFNDTPMFVLAYSDWSAGELGSIYQACSWTYLGTSENNQWQSPDGKIHGDTIHRDKHRSREAGGKTDLEAAARTRSEMEEQGWRMTKTTRGRYATVTGAKGRRLRELKTLLRANSKEYPKIHSPSQ